MGLFETNNYKICISEKFARQRFYCSAEYSALHCHGACCIGPSFVLLMSREAECLQTLTNATVNGQALIFNSEYCPFSLPNGHCRLHNSSIMPFMCKVMPFCLNKNGKLIIENSYMRRSCRVRNDVKGGTPAYKCFGSALVSIFGEANAKIITEHFDRGGGDITVPVTKEVMETLLRYRKVVNDIRKLGYNKVMEMLMEGKYVN